MVVGTRLVERMAAHSAKHLEQALSYSAISPDSDSFLISSGERDKAIKFIRDWFANKVKDYLKIHDPYFGPEDLKILQLLAIERPNCRVEILTSQEHQRNQGLSEPWQNPIVIIGVLYLRTGST